MDNKSIDKLKKRYDGVSSSSIGLIKHPKYYRNYVDRLLDEDTPKYFEIGTQTHMYLLENDKFKESYTFLEFTKPKGDNQNAYCEEIAQKLQEGVKIKKEVLIDSYKKYYAASKKSDEKVLEESKKLYKQLTKYINYLITRDKYKEILSYSTYKYLHEAEYAVKSHIKAKELLFSYNDLIDDPYIYIENEKRVLWEHPTIDINGEPIVCKSFLDRLEIDFKNKKIKLIDLKTSSNLPEFEDKFQTYKYYRQMAFYWMSISYLFKTEFKKYNLKDFSFETYVVVIQTPNMYKDYPIVCKVFPISEQSLEKGYQEINDLLNEIKWHTENKKWEHSKSYYENNGLENIL
jgi:hypothetical protein